MISVNSDSYALHGELPTMPDRPEPPRFDPRTDEIEYGDLLKLFGWTDAQFEAAARYRRPGPVGRRVDPKNHWNLRVMYSRRAFETWRADLVAFARTLR